jgi:hypothetical protein
MTSNVNDDVRAIDLGHADFGFQFSLGGLRQQDLAWPGQLDPVLACGFLPGIQRAAQGALAQIYVKGCNLFLRIAQRDACVEGGGRLADATLFVCEDNDVRFPGWERQREAGGLYTLILYEMGKGNDRSRWNWPNRLLLSPA